MHLLQPYRNYKNIALVVKMNGEKLAHIEKISVINQMTYLAEWARQMLNLWNLSEWRTIRNETNFFA